MARREEEASPQRAVTDGEGRLIRFERLYDVVEGRFATVLLRVTNIEPGLTETEFSVVRFSGDKERADKVYAGAAPMTGPDIAEQVFFACSMPRHVNINRIQSMASQQTFGPLAVKR